MFNFKSPDPPFNMILPLPGYADPVNYRESSPGYATTYNGNGYPGIYY